MNTIFAGSWSMCWRDWGIELPQCPCEGVLVRPSVRRVIQLGLVEGASKTASSRRKMVLSPFLIEVLKQHRLRQLEERVRYSENRDVYEQKESKKRAVEGTIS